MGMLDKIAEYNRKIEEGNLNNKAEGKIIKSDLSIKLNKYFNYLNKKEADAERELDRVSSSSAFFYAPYRARIKEELEVYKNAKKRFLQLFKNHIDLDGIKKYK